MQSKRQHRRRTQATTLRALAALLSCALILLACGVPQPRATSSQVRPAEPPAGPAQRSATTDDAIPAQMSLPTTTPEPSVRAAIHGIIPKPVSVTATGGVFDLTSGAGIYVDPGTTDMLGIGQYLADMLTTSTGYDLRVFEGAPDPAEGNIYLTTSGGDPALGDEGYELRIVPGSLTLVAHQPAGLFRGLQTVRQLLPPAIERPSVQPGPWRMPTGIIRDSPRFLWRGAMLDVARHFFSVEDVKRYIDLVAAYKMNRFHLHLADDQGWRVAIRSWPNLAAIGGSTEVGGGTGGYYTQAEYADIVAYAQKRYIVVVPEIDMPGHVHAALASYPELNCDGVAPPLFTGIQVGFSSLCMEKEITYTFVADVIGEIAALTPGPYIHIGGDEASETEEDDYTRFIQHVQTLVQSHGKRMIGWEEIGQAELISTTIAQHWRSDLVTLAAQQGASVIMSPSTRGYLDEKYDQATPLGFAWAGYVDVETAYAWDPGTQVDGLPEAAILGVEAPLWTETIQTMDDIEFMAFPRLPGIAEIGWSPAAGRSWREYRIRLGAHGPRMTASGVDFYPSPLVPWQ